MLIIFLQIHPFLLNSDVIPPTPTNNNPQLINSIEVETWANDQTFSPRHPSLEHGDRVLSCGSQQEEHVAQG